MDIPQDTFSWEKKKPLKSGGLEYFSANEFSLTEKELEKARIELFETEEEKIIKLQELRDKLANDTAINYRTDTYYLLRFLRVRKYDITKAYQNIKDKYHFKKEHTEFLLISDNLEQLLNQNLFRYLPYTTEKGQVLIHLHLEHWECEETTANDLSTIVSTIMDIITMNPRTQVNGIIVILDAKGLSAQKITAVVHKFGLRALAFAFEKLFPMRLTNILVINPGFFIRLFYQMIRPFLSKKICERIIMLGHDIKELHKYVNPVLLPKSLGGFLDEEQCSVTQNIMDNILYLKYERSFD